MAKDPFAPIQAKIDAVGAEAAQHGFGRRNVRAGEKPVVKIAWTRLERARAHIEAGITRIKYDGHAWALHRGRDAIDDALARDSRGRAAMTLDEMAAVTQGLEMALHLVRNYNGGFADETRGERYSDKQIDDLAALATWFDADWKAHAAHMKGRTPARQGVGWIDLTLAAVGVGLAIAALVFVASVILEWVLQ